MPTLLQLVKARATAILGPLRGGRAWAAAPQHRRQISVFLICLGLSLLLMVAGVYGWMYLEQQRLLAQVQTQATRTLNSSDPTEGGPVLLYIPKIQLRAAVLDGTDRKSLLLAPGHVKDTAWPGEAGNAVVAGHRDTFFRHLHELKKGDDIYVRRNGQEFHYVISRKFLVDPTDVSVTRATKDYRLTLITCYPTYFVGPAPQRLIIVATLGSESPPPGTHSAM